MGCGKWHAPHTVGSLKLLKSKDFALVGSTFRKDSTSTVQTLGINYEIYVASIALVAYGSAYLALSGARGRL